VPVVPAGGPLPSLLLAAVAVRSKAKMAVTWAFPPALAQRLSVGRRALVVGLLRVGMPTNNATVINKAVAAGAGDGCLDFHAPQSAGVFVFRLFDEDDPVATYAASDPFAVVVQQRCVR
jgi:hypothetical protein